VGKNKNQIAVCVVANFKYLYKNFPRIYTQLRTNGKYSGEILVITNILCPTFLIKYLKKNNKVSVLRFKKIVFDSKAEQSLSNLSIGSNRHINKNFQWYKLHLFSKKIKQWKYIFYLDINMHIHDDIKPILDIKPKNKIYARSDGYPTYNWQLSSQFDINHPKFQKLSESFNLKITTYFQTGVMYFDTGIIEQNTYSELIALVNKYPFSITNEQGILNLYFIFIKNNFEELAHEVENKITYFYWLIENKDVIISKALTTQRK